MPVARDIAILPRFPSDAGYSVQITGAITTGIHQIRAGAVDASRASSVINGLHERSVAATPGCARV
mgnify:CR=1 FL=1